MAQRYGQSPSDLMDLRESGVSGPTRYAFNRAVMSLGRIIDARLQETDRASEPDGPKAPTGSHWTQKPRYTLNQLLYDGPGDGADVDESGPVPASLANLPTAGL